MRTAGLVFALGAVVAAISGALGYRVRVLPLGPAFLLFGAGALAAFIAILLSLLALIVGFAKHSRGDGLGRAALGLVIALVVIAIPLGLFLSRRGSGMAPIHDITTDTVDPPRFVDVLPLRADAPNSADYEGGKIAEQQKRAHPDVGPLIVSSAPDATFDRALAAADSMGWTLAGSNRQEGRIEATDTTFWFGFQDDVVIRIRPDGQGSRIDVRSVSRVGGGDLGTNAKRIREFLVEIQRN